MSADLDVGRITHKVSKFNFIRVGNDDTVKILVGLQTFFASLYLPQLASAFLKEAN